MVGRKDQLAGPSYPAQQAGLGRKGLEVSGTSGLVLDGPLRPDSLLAGLRGPQQAGDL